MVVGMYVDMLVCDCVDLCTVYVRLCVLRCVGVCWYVC